MLALSMSELMRDDPHGDSSSFGDLVVAIYWKCAKQHLPAARPRQKETIGRRRVPASAKIWEALDQLADKTNPPEPTVRFSFCPSGT